MGDHKGRPYLDNHNASWGWRKTMTSFPDPEKIENDLLHTLLQFRAAQVLEVGCGDGRMTRHYVAGTSLVYGMDTDFDELLASREDYLKAMQAKVRLTQGRAEALPYASGSFDLVLLGWSL